MPWLAGPACVPTVCMCAIDTCISHSRGVTSDVVRLASAWGLGAVAVHVSVLGVLIASNATAPSSWGSSGFPCRWPCGRWFLRSGRIRAWLGRLRLGRRRGWCCSLRWGPNVILGFWMLSVSNDGQSPFFVYCEEHSPSPLRRLGRSFRRVPISGTSGSGSSGSLVGSLSRWPREAALCLRAPLMDLDLDSSSDGG